MRLLAWGVVPEPFVAGEIFAATHVRGVAAGGDHTVAIRRDTGRLVAWGRNTQGQLGTGTNADSSTPTTLSIINATVAAAGHEHTLAVINGRVFAWGRNSSGQLGDGTTTDSNSPVFTEELLEDVVAVAAGRNHSLAVTTDGTVFAWGDNSFGQLGIGPDGDSVIPIKVSGLAGVVAVAAGRDHSLALRNDGTVLAWGANESGQLGIASTTDSDVPVPVAGALKQALALAAGARHSLALNKDGTVVAWGDNTSGQLGNGTVDDSNLPIPVSRLAGVLAVAAGWDHSLALVGEGKVLAWGNNAQGQLGNSTTNGRTVPALVHLSGAAAVAAGRKHSVALKTDGTVVSWGANESGQLGNEKTTNDHHLPLGATGYTRVQKVKAAAKNIWALMTDGTFGGLPDLVSDVTDFWVGDNHGFALRSDGELLGWGANSFGELGLTTSMPDAHPVTSIFGGAVAFACGTHHTLALMGDGTVMSCGSNEYGQLGDGSTTDRKAPVPVSNLTKVVAIAAGTGHSVALKSDGTVLWWGYCNHIVKTVPVPVRMGGGPDKVMKRASNLTGVVAIGAHLGYNLAVKKDGSVLRWGGQAWVFAPHMVVVSDLQPHPTHVQGPRIVGAVAVAVGDSHNLILRSNGQVLTFGREGWKAKVSETLQLVGGSSDPLEGVVEIAAGDGFSLALVE